MPTFVEDLTAKLTNPHRLKPYKASSVKPVIAYMRTLNGGVTPTSVDFLLDRPIIMRHMEKYAIATQRSIVFIINNVAHAYERQDILDVWKENIEETKAGKGLLPKGERSEKQEKAYALVESDKRGDAWDTLTKKLEANNEAFKGKEGDLQYLVPNLYIRFPPRRNIDYTDMMIATDETDITKPDKNYLLIQEIKGKVGMLYLFNRYKTSGVYRQQQFDVPEDLTEILMKYIKANGKKDGDWLLTRSGKGANLKGDDLPPILHRVFGAGISTQMLRHMYLDKYNTPERKLIIEEMMGDADMMAHSIMTQQDTYVKR